MAAYFQNEGSDISRIHNFNRLVDSVKQFVQIKRGEMKPSRVFEFNALDVRALRESLHKSQSEFAKIIGVSLATLQNLDTRPPQTLGPSSSIIASCSNAT